MTVYIGNAVCDENGTAGSKTSIPGNQTGKELRIQPWYLNKKGWVVLRPKSDEVAKRLSEDMRFACENMDIGYNQSNRNTLYNIASKVGFDCSKVSIPCECDCSSLVRVCCAYAGILVKNFNTASEASVLVATGKFEKLTDAKYTDSSSYLREGDILITSVKGHTAIVLNSGNKAGKDVDPIPPQPSPSPTPSDEKDAYVLVSGSVNVRTVPKPSKGSKIVYVAHKGEKLPYLGKTEIAQDGSEWYCVSTPKGNGCISAYTFANPNKKYTKLILSESNA